MLGEIDRGSGALELDDQPAGRRPMQQAVEFRAWVSDAASHGDRHALRSRIEVRQNAKQQVAVEFGERLPDDLFQIEEFVGIGAGLDDAVIGFADDQQGAMRLNGAREMNLFPFAVRKIGFSERWGGQGMRRQLNPLGVPRYPTPCRRGRRG